MYFILFPTLKYCFSPLTSSSLFGISNSSLTISMFCFSLKIAQRRWTSSGGVTLGACGASSQVAALCVLIVQKMAVLVLHRFSSRIHFLGRMRLLLVDSVNPVENQEWHTIGRSHCLMSALSQAVPKYRDVAGCRKSLRMFQLQRFFPIHNSYTVSNVCYYTKVMSDKMIDVSIFV